MLGTQIICTGHVLQKAKLLEDRTVRLKKMDVTSSIRMQNSDTRMLTNSKTCPKFLAYTSLQISIHNGAKHAVFIQH